MLAKPLTAIWTLFLLISTAQAQFQFFEQMFGGGGSHQGHQQEQEASSDSSWYQQTWEGSEHILDYCVILQTPYWHELIFLDKNSTLHEISMSGHVSLRPFPASLSMSASKR